MKFNLAKIIKCLLYQSAITKSFIFFSGIIVIYLTVIKRVSAAPENFNPEIESTPESELSDSQGDRDNSPPKPVNPAPQIQPKPKKPQPNIPLPEVNLSDESSIESGTADIDLRSKPKKNSDTSPDFSTITIENLSFDLKLDFDNFGQTNLLINQAIDFNLFNLDFVLNTGVNLFKQDNLETVNNIPLYLSWLTKIKKIDLTITGGVDFFDNLPATPRFSLKGSTPLFASVTEDGKLKSLFVISAQGQYQAYKFNAATLTNEITLWRFTPSIYWQIIPNLSLFTLGQYGSLSDRNQEWQSFSRLEKKIGSFSLAANLFTWHFESDLSQTSGYFSPQNFLVYNGELAWQGKMFDETLDCKLSLAFGKQKLDGATDNAWTYKTLCSTNLLSNLELDLGFTYSNVRDRNTGDTSFGNQSIHGKLNIQF